MSFQLELTLRLRVRCATALGHHRDELLAGHEPPEPLGHVTGRLGTEHLGEVGKPLCRRRRLVVDDVVEAAPAALDRGERRACDVVDVDERPDSCAAADDRELALANRLDVLAILEQRRTGPVEAAVAERDPFDRLGADDGVLEVTNRRHGLRGTLRRGGVERRRFVLHGGALLRVRPAGEALGNELPGAGRLRSRQQIVRADRFAGGSSPRTPRRGLRMLVKPDSAVAWCTTTSGSASETARPTASASRTSSTTGSAPRARRSLTLPGDRVVPTTSCPFAPSRGTSRFPTAPVAPAMKIFMISLLSFASGSRTRSCIRL